VRRKNVKGKSEKRRKGSVNERSEWVQVKALEVRGGDDGKAGGETEVVAVEEASKDRISERGRITELILTCISLVIPRWSQGSF
jgi:hypothetical protein